MGGEERPSLFQTPGDEGGVVDGHHNKRSEQRRKPTVNKTTQKKTRAKKIKQTYIQYLLDAHATVQERHEVGNLVGDLVHHGGGRHGPADGVAAAEESAADHEPVGKVVHLAFEASRETFQVEVI